MVTNKFEFFNELIQEVVPFSSCCEISFHERDAELPAEEM
jgi:hypothetical protein